MDHGVSISEPRVSEFKDLFALRNWMESSALKNQVALDWLCSTVVYVPAKASLPVSPASNHRWYISVMLSDNLLKRSKTSKWRKWISGSHRPRPQALARIIFSMGRYFQLNQANHANQANQVSRAKQPKSYSQIVANNLWKQTQLQTSKINQTASSK